MSLDRRQFLLSTAALAASARSAFPDDAATSGVLPASIRADFPIASAQTYLNSAAIHPMSVHAARALQQHIEFRTRGGGEGRMDFGDEQQKDLKRRFAAFIGATANEIAFIQNTSDGENIVVMGMDLPKRGGNVVLDELHFETSLYMYKSLEAKGVELRLVKHRDWAIDIKDMERAIDKNTRLVSMALYPTSTATSTTPRRSAISPMPTAPTCLPTWCRPRVPCRLTSKRWASISDRPPPTSG
jgi:selenocysteine lyase/cysteine desulfurase